MEYTITLKSDEHGLDQAALRAARDVVESRLHQADRRTTEGKQLKEALVHIVDAQRLLRSALGEKS